MSSPDQAADGKDRSAATGLVERALAAGRIIQADHDVRVHQIRAARTLQDLDLVVRDLREADVPPQVPAQVPAQTPVAAAVSAAPAVAYGPASDSGSDSASDPAAEVAAFASSGAGRALGTVIGLVVMLAVVVPLVGAIIAFTSSRDSFPDFDDFAPSDDTTYLPGQEAGERGVNVFTVDGFRELASALEEETGQKYVFLATIYPRYAVLQVPTGTNDRYQNWYWDGATLELQDFRSSSANDQIDLTLIEPQLLVDLVEQTCTRVDDPDSWYASLSDFEQTETQVTTYCSNEFDESAYLTATLDGTITYDSTAQE